MLALVALWALSQDKPDVVVLKNGDTISGSIVHLLEGVLTVRTEYSKEVKIEAAKIRSLATSKPVTVELVDGEVLKGRLQAGAEGRIVVVSDLAGKTIEIEMAKVKAINPPPVVPAKYRGAVAVGATLSEGNTDRFTFAVSAEAERRTADDRISFRFLFNYAEEADVRTARNLFAGLKYDYFFSKQFYAYLEGSLFSDTFKDLELRATASVGVGYQWIETEELAFSTEAGIAYLSNNFDESEDISEVAMRLAANFRWKITDGITFTDAFVVFPFREGGEILVRNEASLAIGLGNWLGGTWALKFANIIDFDSNPSDDFKRTDVLWLLALQYTFG